MGSERLIGELCGARGAVDSLAVVTTGLFFSGSLNMPEKNVEAACHFEVLLVDNKWLCLIVPLSIKLKIARVE